MGNELEKRFFQCFEIEPRYEDACTVEDKYWNNEDLANEYGTFDQYMNCKCGNQESCNTECSYAYQREVYPDITDRILLELICIASQPDVYIEIEGKDVETIKNNLLENFIHFKSIIPKHKIRILFEEEQ